MLNLRAATQHGTGSDPGLCENSENWRAETVTRSWRCHWLQNRGAVATGSFTQLSTC